MQLLHLNSKRSNIMSYLTSIRDIPEFATANLQSDQIYMPRPLIEHHISDLTAKGVTAYSVYLNRLEAPLDFVKKGYDKQGNVFIYFTNKELEKLLDSSKDTIIRVKKRLHEYHLIEEVQQGMGKPNRIYLTDEILKYYH